MSAPTVTNTSHQPLFTPVFILAVTVASSTTSKVGQSSPMLTRVVPVKLTPVMVTTSPLPFDVLAGEKPVTAGGGASHHHQEAHQEAPQPVDAQPHPRACRPGCTTSWR